MAAVQHRMSTQMQPNQPMQLDQHWMLIVKLPLCPPHRDVGYSLSDVNAPSAVVPVTCTPACTTFVDTAALKGYFGSAQLLTAAEQTDLQTRTGRTATHKLVTGTVAAEKLYKIKLWGINPFTPEGTASAAESDPVATLGESQAWHLHDVLYTRPACCCVGKEQLWSCLASRNHLLFPLPVLPCRRARCAYWRDGRASFYH